MKHQKVSWWLAGFVAIALLCSGALWMWMRPSPIVIPPRQYPPNNAYDAYKALAAKMQNDLGRDQRFRKIERVLYDQHSRDKVSQADKAYYIQKMQPYLKEYRQYLDQPSVAVYEYDFNWLFPEMADFRQLARAEALLIREALERNQPREAVERITAQLRFAEQIRNEGIVIHHLLGSAMIAIVLSPLREHFENLNDPTALQRVVDMARRYERERVTLDEVMTAEYYFGLSFYRDLRRGKVKMSDLVGDPHTLEEWFLYTGLGTTLMLSATLREYEQLWEAKRVELQKPPWVRKDPAIRPKMPLNQGMNISLESLSKAEALEMATMRLLGCAAAIKLYKQRTGRYPNTLSDLNLGDLAIDPFTGKPFIYRHDPKKGFQLYSVGVNRVDDGGRITNHESNGGDINPALPPPSQRPKAPGALSAPVWIR